jgi:hypothetical protein
MWSHQNVYAVFAITVCIREADRNPDGEPPAKKAKVIDDIEGLYDSPDIFSDPEGLLTQVKEEVLTNSKGAHSEDMQHALVPCIFDVLMTWPRSGTTHMHVSYMRGVCLTMGMHCTTCMYWRTLRRLSSPTMASPT